MTMRLLLALAGAAAVAGCAGGLQNPFERPAVQTAEPAAPSPGGGIAPPSGARTADEFDTTSAAERAAAVAEATPEAGAEAELGTTVASLGDPSEPGFWLETPLVSATRRGRVVYPQTGNSVRVELRPIDGPAGAGSRVSLAALRLLGAPLTDLPTLTVYTQ